MKCSLEYRRGAWVCESSDLPRLLDANPRPDDKVLCAINAFHRRYYPDEPIKSSRYPWQQHKRGKIATLKSKIAIHELTWHWRLLLPCLRNYNDELDVDTSVVLCVSQIRQWQLVTCFSMKWPDTKLPSDLRRGNKALLRPPVFGKSHRITRWEVYMALYEQTVLTQIRNAVDAADGDSWRLAHVLGRHDTYFRIRNPKWNVTKTKLELDIEQVTDLEPEQASAELDAVTITDICRPYGGASVPFFSDSPKDLPKTEDVLFSSDNYCRAFEQVSDVLNDAGSRAVLVIAPPGSGKEKICEILHSCRRHSGRRAVISLAGIDTKTAAYQLFSLHDHTTIDNRFDITPTGLVLNDKFRISQHDGLFFKALGGTLVVDELDKASNDVRSMLLRLLENDEVSIPDVPLVVRIPREVRPLLVFAGSKTRKEFMQLAPIDLWSRMTHIVEMQHPLALGEDADRLRVAQDYLRLFWFKQVEQNFKDEGFLKTSPAVYEPLQKRFAEWWRFFCSRAIGDFVAQELAATLCGDGQALPSIRTLRGTTTRCFNILFTSLLYHKNSDAPLEVWRKRQKASTFDPPAGLKELLAWTIESTPRHRKLSFTEVKVINELRSMIQSSATIQV